MDTRARLPGWGRPLSPVLAATVVGALWGLAGYALLWGYTPIVVHRPFVVSPLGTALLLPIRLVLWGIRVAERAAGHPFDFSETNGWIGGLAALVGACLVAVVALGTRSAVRALWRPSAEAVRGPGKG